MSYIVSFLVGFIAGSIPFGYIIAKLRGVDILKVGSGNIGATNVARVCGKPLGVTVFILDTLKGLLPILLISHKFSPNSNPAIICGVGALLGHTFTPWLKGRGGKGVATGLGIFIGLVPIPALIAFGVWVVLVLIFGWVSLASMSAAFVLVVIVFLEHHISPLSFMVLFGFLLILFLHRKNIHRLIHHQEPKIR